MFEKERAEELAAQLRKLTASIEQTALEENDLYKKVGGTGPATPEGVAIASAKVQIIHLTEAVGTIGRILLEMLLDEGHEKELGLKP